MNSIKIRDEKGQSLILVAFAILTLLAFVGLAVDLGMAYVERIRVRRAADAAALAAAAELPLEDAAHIRALEYLEDNDYGCDLQVSADATMFSCNDTSTVRLEINGNYISGPAEDDATRTVRLNTVDFRDDPYQADSADRIRVEIIEDAPVYFMKLFDFFKVPVKGSATAENINHLDIALVFDRSGSMEFDTLCYGCWTPSSDEYPDGHRYPLLWDGDTNGQPDHCEGNGPLVYSGKKYIIIEAEEYGMLSNAYNRALYTQGYTYWVLQRNGSQTPSYIGHAGAYGRDSYGGYIEHMPPRIFIGADGLGIPCTWADLNNGRMCRRDAQLSAWGGPYPAPRVDYKFTVPDNGTWYFWIRGQGGDRYNSLSYIHWGIDDNPIGAGRVDHYSSYPNGADSSRWDWRRLGCGEGYSLPCGQSLLKNHTYTLNIWAGTSGFALDRIVITNNSSSSLPSHVRTSNHFDNNRTDWACDPCDARFGGSPSPADPRLPTCTSAMAPQPYRYLDDIYDDEQPIRAATESAKKFIRRLDPRYDQIGYVYYSSSATIKDRLECVRRRGIDTCGAGYDPDSGLSSDIIENTVIKHLDQTHAGGSTNIGHGIMLGKDVLSNRVIDGHQNYGRPGAAHIMIVMTDGRTNTLSGVDTPECYQDDLWPHNDTGNTTWDRAKDCAVYYAMQARNNGIVIYTITLGNTADVELMQYIAELTGGTYNNAPRPEQLDPIFDDLYKRIFLRLVD